METTIQSSLNHLTPFLKTLRCLQSKITYSLKPLWHYMLNHSINKCNYINRLVLSEFRFMILVVITDSFAIIVNNTSNCYRWTGNITLPDILLILYNYNTPELYLFEHLPPALLDTSYTILLLIA